MTKAMMLSHVHDKPAKGMALSNAKPVTSMASMTDRSDIPAPGVAQPQPIATPCIKVCAVDGATGLCFGCGRNMNEIARWAVMAPTEREAIMTELPERMKTIEARLSGAAGEELG